MEWVSILWTDRKLLCHSSPDFKSRAFLVSRVCTTPDSCFSKKTKRSCQDTFGPMIMHVLGVQWTRRPALTQIQHSYWCKNWNQPKGFTLGVKAEFLKNFPICPQVVINAELYGLVLASRLKKGDHQIWEANLQPWGPMLQHLLISWRQCSSIY